MSNLPPSEAYQRLVRSGYVSSQKRDMLMAASRDLEYIGTTVNRFRDDSAMAAREAVACAVELIEDLIQMGLCQLATWSEGYGSKPTAIQRTRAELEIHLTEYHLEQQHVWELLLISTPLGDEWVRRYHALVAELDAPSGDRTAAAEPGND